MKVALFEIHKDHASLRYRSGEELTTPELELLMSYIHELLNEKIRMEPRK